MGGWWAGLNLPRVTGSELGVYGRQRVTCKKVPHTLSLCLSHQVLYQLMKQFCRTRQAKLSMLVKEVWCYDVPFMNGTVGSY